MRPRALASEDATETNRAPRGPKSRRTTKRLAVAAALLIAGVAALAAVGGASAMVRTFSSSVHLSHHAVAAADTLPSSVQMYQWETSPSGGWITGNLGDHNSAYSEGQVIPFKLDVSGVTAGTYSFAVCRDFQNGTTYGYLKLAPFETDYTTDAGTTSSSGDFSYTSGISGLTGTDTGAAGGCGAGHVETDVTFTTDGTSNQFIYWGGYLAAPLDPIPAPGSGTVGFQHSAGFYSGSSLHMVLLSPNKDRSINPGSIIRLAEITASKVVDSGTAHPDSWCFTIDAGPQAGVCETPNADLLGGDGLNDSYQFLALPGGTYHITESTVAGYEFDHGVNTLNCPFTGSTAVPVVTASTAGTTNATCEFHNKLSKTTPTVLTTLHNAAGDGIVANNSTLDINSSLYDTAAVTASGSLTGTVTFQFFNNGTCANTATATDTGVAVGTQSTTRGPLAAGSYSFRAMYVAGTDPNHNDSAWSTCEPFSIGKGTPSVLTTLHNAAGNGVVANNSTLDINSSLYDTAAVTAGDGLALTGTVNFQFFTNGTCANTANATDTGVALGTQSSTRGPLAAGSYSFRAMYVAGTDPNHNDSAWSTCEPFSIGKGTPTVLTTLHNAAGNGVVANNSTLDINSSLYDTAAVSATDGLALTGTVDFQFFTNGTCANTANASDTGVAVGTQSTTRGPLAAGSYSFRAMYVAGTDPNHSESAWSTCEPFSIGKGTPSVLTTLHNAAGDAIVANNSTLDINSSLYDTAAVTAGDGLALTGTVSFQFFHNIDCTTPASASDTGVALGTQSSTRGPLAAGSYSFRAMYVAGTDPNHNDSAWSTCEPFSIGKGTPSVVTTLHNASGDAIVANGSTLNLNSSLYDTAAVTAGDGLALTGTVSFQFFHNIDCTTPASASDTGVAVGTPSSTRGPLAAGSYSFRAMYVAGNDPNHSDSAWSACEPFSIGKGTPSVETTLKNAAGDGTVDNGSTLEINSSVYDTAAVTATDGLDLTGTVSYQFFNNGDCSGEVASETGVAVGTQSTTHGPLAAGAYSFHAMYIAGNDANHNNSAWSACEPFSIGKGTPTVETTLKNAAGDGTVDNGTTLDINSSVYDTAAVTATDGLDLTGTVSYQFFNNGDCSGEVASESVSVGTESSTQGPLEAGSYSFHAMYVAGNDANHTNSAWSACEPFSIGKGTPTVETTLKNAADGTTVDNGSTLPINSSVYDTADVTAADELDLTGTVSYQFFANGTCSGESTNGDSGVALDGQSSTQGPLSAGSYSFRARYVAGDDSNHNNSDWSACEPFSVGKAKPAVTTTPSAGGTIGTSVHDTAVLSGSVRATGTIAFALYGVNDTTCTGTPLFTGSANVSGNGSVDSASYTPAAAGTYRWVATYSGDTNNEAAASKCGDELVTITSPPVVPPVTPPPPPVIDLAITKTGSPNPATLGKNVTWTMVVTNNGPNDATGVKVADPVPAGTTYVSSSSTQGTCTGGVVVNCSLGNVAKGASATITLVTTTTATGTITNTTTVVGNEHDSNTTNNTATATVTVQGAFVPPVTYCTAVAVTPKSLVAGRTNKLTLKVAQHGRAAIGVRIRIKGASVNVVTQRSNAKGIVKQTIKPTKAGIVTFSPVAVKSCKNVRVGILGVFTPPVTG